MVNILLCTLDKIDSHLSMCDIVYNMNQEVICSRLRVHYDFVYLNILNCRL